MPSQYLCLAVRKSVLVPCKVSTCALRANARRVRTHDTRDEKKACAWAHPPSFHPALDALASPCSPVLHLLAKTFKYINKNTRQACRGTRTHLGRDQRDRFVSRTRFFCLACMLYSSFNPASRDRLREILSLSVSRSYTSYCMYTTSYCTYTSYCKKGMPPKIPGLR